MASFEGHTGNVVAVGFQKEGQWMYTGSEDGTIKIWDMRGPSCQRDYFHKGAVNTVVLHPNQGELISGDQNGSIKIWDLTANTCSHELVPDEGVPIRSLSVAADGSMLVACNNKVLSMTIQERGSCSPMNRIFVAQLAWDDRAWYTSGGWRMGETRRI